MAYSRYLTKTAIRNQVIGAGRYAIRHYGMATSTWRPDPDFLIIGAKRGGSTSLYYDLARHEAICPLFPRPRWLPKARETKGIHYFDSNFFRGEAWYRSHLPSRAARASRSRTAGVSAITGEASPYYLHHPAAAARAHALLPNAKIIAVLRDPVMRAYSHWKERSRAGAEQLSFREALTAEDVRVGDVEQELARNPRAHSYAHENYSYARQSEYATGLARWYAVYPRSQIMIIGSEEYYREPQVALDGIVDFLGLPRQPMASGVTRNAAEGEEINPDIRARLSERFAPHNARLMEMTGRPFPWSV